MTRRRVTQRPRSRLDLLEQYVYFDEQSGAELAERYLAAVEETCSRLAIHPESGTPYDSGIRHLRGSRRCPVAGFENYLIFYIPAPSGIDVIRVFFTVCGTLSICCLKKNPN